MPTDYEARGKAADKALDARLRAVAGAIVLSVRNGVATVNAAALAELLDTLPTPAKGWRAGAECGTEEQEAETFSAWRDGYMHLLTVVTTHHLDAMDAEDAAMVRAIEDIQQLLSAPEPNRGFTATAGEFTYFLKEV